MTTGMEEPSGWWPAAEEPTTLWTPAPAPAPEPPREPAPTSHVDHGRAPGSDPATGITINADRSRSTRPARLALGLAVLAAERLRTTGRAVAERPRNAAPSAAFATGVGLLQQGAAEAREVARRAMGRPARFAALTRVLAANLPGGDLPSRTLGRSRAAIDRIVAEARDRGEAAVTESRADASAFVQATVSDAIGWAQAQAIPQIVDGLVPHLVDTVVPRLIDGAMPEIRSRVLPVVIDDLTNDPRVRELAMEQGRGMVGDAAEHLRSTTANADDRVESAFRRLVRGAATERETAPPAGTG